MGVKEEFLRLRMEEQHISQADLARKTEIPPGTISSFLRSDDGIEKTSYGNVRKICDVLGVNVDDLERIGPDGKLPVNTMPAIPVSDAADELVGTEENSDDMEFEAVAGEATGVPAEDENNGAETVMGEKEEVHSLAPDGFIGYDPEEEGLLEIRRYFVVSRLAACSEEDIGRMVSVIPSVHEVEENGVYAVRLPESRMTVLRKIWRMEDGLLLLSTDRFDENPRIIRPDTKGFSVVGKVVESGDAPDLLC